MNLDKNTIEYLSNLIPLKIKTNFGVKIKNVNPTYSSFSPQIRTIGKKIDAFYLSIDTKNNYFNSFIKFNYSKKKISFEAIYLRQSLAHPEFKYNSEGIITSVGIYPEVGKCFADPILEKNNINKDDINFNSLYKIYAIEPNKIRKKYKNIKIGVPKNNIIDFVLKGFKIDIKRWKLRYYTTSKLNEKYWILQRVWED